MRCILILNFADHSPSSSHFPPIMPCRLTFFRLTQNQPLFCTSFILRVLTQIAADPSDLVWYSLWNILTETILRWQSSPSVPFLNILFYIVFWPHFPFGLSSWLLLQCLSIVQIWHDCIESGSRSLEIAHDLDSCALFTGLYTHHVYVSNSNNNWLRPVLL